MYQKRKDALDSFSKTVTLVKTRSQNKLPCQ